jgi:hypothetical protein
MSEPRAPSRARISLSLVATALVLASAPALASADTDAHIARDVQEIQNLMSRRAFYHSVGRNELELALWAKKTPIRWAQNQGCWIGMDSLKVYYDDINRKMQAADLARVSKLNPAVKDVPENRGVGNNALHLLTTPIIEVAGDGRTAKGMWYTPGVIMTSNDGRTPAAFWIWERYGVDFIREDGHWAFLHVQVNTDFINPMGHPMEVQSEDAAAMGSENGTKSAAAGPNMPADLKIPGPDIPKKLYREFGASRVPVLTPALPEPYQTLSQTFEYADCGKK